MGKYLGLKEKSCLFTWSFRENFEWNKWSIMNVKVRDSRWNWLWYNEKKPKMTYYMNVIIWNKLDWSIRRVHEWFLMLDGMLHLFPPFVWGAWWPESHFELIVRCEEGNPVVASCPKGFGPVLNVSEELIAIIKIVGGGWDLRKFGYGNKSGQYGFIFDDGRYQCWFETGQDPTVVEEEKKLKIRVVEAQELIKRFDRESSAVIAQADTS